MPIGRFGAPEKSRKLLSPGDECSDCGRPMRLRTRKSDGKQFLGCSGFPDCKHTEADFRDPAFDTRQPSLFDKAQMDIKAKVVASRNTGLPIVTATQNAPPLWPNQGLMLNEFECKRLLDVAYTGLKDNKDTDMLELIAKLEEYCTKHYRKAVWEGEPTVQSVTEPQEEF